MNNDKDIMERVEVKTPWFRMTADDIDWKTVVVVAMILAAVVYIIKG